MLPLRSRIRRPHRTGSRTIRLVALLGAILIFLGMSITVPAGAADTDPVDTASPAASATPADAGGADATPEPPAAEPPAAEPPAAEPPAAEPPAPEPPAAKPEAAPAKPAATSVKSRPRAARTTTGAGKPVEVHKVSICHATSSDSNPYTYISVDKNSTKYAGHLMHRNSPNKTWKGAGTFNGAPHHAGDPKPDLIDGLDGVITEASCGAAPVLEVVAVTKTVEQPSCANSGVGTLSVSGDHVRFTPPSGVVTGGPGETVRVSASSDDGFVFSDGEDTQTYSVTFDTYVAPEGQHLDETGACVPDDEELRVIDDPMLVLTQPSCDNDGQGSWTASGEHITFDPGTSGAGSAGERVVLLANADDGYVFGDDATSKDLTFLFDTYDAPEGQHIDETGACVPDDRVLYVVDDPTLVLTQPSCDNDGQGSWTVSGEHMTFDPGTSGVGSAGGTVSLFAQADDGYKFGDGNLSKDLTFTFGTYAAPDGQHIDESGACVPDEKVLLVIEDPTLDLVQPSCANSGHGSWTASGTHVTFDPGTSGTGSAGEVVALTASADDGYKFGDGNLSKDLTFTFGTYSAPEGFVILEDGSCAQVEAPPVATPVVPVFTDPTCDVPQGTVTIPQPIAERSFRSVQIDGIVYTITGSTAPGGTATVTGTVQEGYVLDPAYAGDLVWSHTFPKLGVCTQVSPPEDPTATPVITVVTHHSPTVVPTTVHAGLAGMPGGAGQDGGQLPAGLFLGVGILLLALADVLRRRTTGSTR